MKKKKKRARKGERGDKERKEKRREGAVDEGGRTVKFKKGED